jgi:presenilin-like A22 family membrane protease
MSKPKGIKALLPIFPMIGLFLLIQGLGLILIKPFETAGMFVFDNPGDPLNVVYFVSFLLLFTVVILLIGKFWKKQVIKGIILGGTAYMVFYVLYPLLYLLVPAVWALFLSIVATSILVTALIRHPEWYVIDLCGIIVGVGAIAMIGISLSVFLSIVLLVALAIYDAISVYKTKHMIDLADIVLDLKLPSMLVIPKTRGYSLTSDPKSLKERLKEGGERDAFFLGLGDVIMPGILSASVLHHVATKGLPIAISVVVGTLLGFILLMVFAIKGKPQAGLPYLCSGAILGYLLSSYILFGRLVGLSSI